MKRTGKYMFIGNINGLFGPAVKYSDTIKKLRLSRYDREDISRGVAALFTVRCGGIVRINANGNAR